MLFLISPSLFCFSSLFSLLSFSCLENSLLSYSLYPLLLQPKQMLFGGISCSDVVNIYQYFWSIPSTGCYAKCKSQSEIFHDGTIILDVVNHYFNKVILFRGGIQLIYFPNLSAHLSDFFYLGVGGKSNPVFLQGASLISGERWTPLKTSCGYMWSSLHSIEWSLKAVPQISRSFQRYKNDWEWPHDAETVCMVMAVCNPGGGVMETDWCPP